MRILGLLFAALRSNVPGKLSLKFVLFCLHIDMLSTYCVMFTR